MPFQEISKHMVPRIYGDDFCFGMSAKDNWFIMYFGKPWLRGNSIGNKSQDSIHVDYDEFGVTIQRVSSPFLRLSDIGSPRCRDYVPGPKEPEQAPPSPDYVPGPEHADDEIIVEDQPYAEDASPTTQDHLTMGPRSPILRSGPDRRMDYDRPEEDSY
ncbi:hypothetical protein Tco_0565564 [Tanacetum coccineum]